MSQLIETHRDGLTISTDPKRLDLEVICDFFTRAYWAKGRPRARTERALANSLVFGVYDGARQVGLARVITDFSIFAYLCDVFIHEEYRGRGVGKWLLETVFSHPDLAGLRRWTLATSDAHGLYRRYGFDGLGDPGTWMERVRPFPEEGAG
jgi:GNAT superfamily N-acetyltransferase